MNAHAELSVYDQHRSYARGCRCRPCTKGHAAYMRDWRRSQGPTSGDGQASLLDQDRDNGSRRSTPVAGSALDNLRTPTSASVGRHHSNGKPTEIKAARSVTLKAGSQRGRILVAIAEVEEGLTQWEITHRLDILRSSVCARVNELETSGWIEPRGETKRAGTTVPEHIYFATTSGKRWARKLQEQPA